MPSKKAKTAGTSFLAIVVAVLLFVAQQLGWINLNPDNPRAAPRPRQTDSSSTRQREPLPQKSETAGTSDQTAQPSAQPAPDNDPYAVHPITELQNKNRSGVNVTASGTIIKVLPDDNEGSRHQRFLVKLSDGHVIKISHNIDLAPRIENPREGDTLNFRGDFEANDLGGVVHWTHHDPQRRHPDGYLEHDGQRYQ